MVHKESQAQWIAMTCLFPVQKGYELAFFLFHIFPSRTWTKEAVLSQSYGGDVRAMMEADAS
jgi:hypothetical protein